MANLAPEFIQDDLAGQIDGINTTFTTRHAYISGTLIFYWNGTPLAHGKGLTEIPPTQFELDADSFGIGRPPSASLNNWATYFA